MKSLEWVHMTCLKTRATNSMSDVMSLAQVLMISVILLPIIIAHSDLYISITLAQTPQVRAPQAQALQAQKSQAQGRAHTLGAARRVFSADLDRDGSDELLVANQSQLTAHRWDGAAWGTLWSISGPGVAQQVVSDSRSPELWIAWGMGLGAMSAPITVSALDPLTGASRDVWSYRGARSQVVNLAFVEVDQDPEPELLIAHFVNKYHTRRVILDGVAEGKPQEHATTTIRMGTSWAVADIDGSPGLEEIIGRVYGDVKGEYGDLSTQRFTLDRGRLTLGQVEPTQRGVKALEPARPELGGGLFFSDGWVAAYGKQARAGLKRLRWVRGRPTIERLVDSPNEFTFFRFWQRRLPAPSGAWVIFAQGNRGVNLITPTHNGPWRLTQLHKTPPIVNAAVGYAGGHWWVFTPHPDGAKAHTVKLPEYALKRSAVIVPHQSTP